MTEEIDLLSIEEAGTVTLTGWDVLVIGILAETYDRVVDAGLVQYSEEFFIKANEFLDKVGEGTKDVIGMNPFAPVEEVNA